MDIERKSYFLFIPEQPYMSIPEDILYLHMHNVVNSGTKSPQTISLLRLFVKGRAPSGLFRLLFAFEICSDAYDFSAWGLLFISFFKRNEWTESISQSSSHFTPGAIVTWLEVKRDRDRETGKAAEERVGHLTRRPCEFESC